ncbi:MAG TPA: IPT/TIG domain-containing protein [Terriglobales bacterium]|jgi:hypothetical protein|nr:IPT/TIG domain-containing protein [Terriglobales bacterium]
MRPSPRLLCAVAVSITFLTAAGRATAQIAITAATPSTAKPGDITTIAGTNFGGAASTSMVKFGSTSVTVAPGSWSNTSIKVTVPDIAIGPTNLVVSVGGADSASFPFVVAAPTTIPITVTPKVIQPANGKLPAAINLAVIESNCDDKTGTDLTQPVSAPYSLMITGTGLTPSSQPTATRCAITAAITVDPSAAGSYKVFLVDKAKNPVGWADIAVLDSSAGAIPPGLNPQVDVMWEVMSQNNCSDTFGKRVAQSLYCIQLKIGNNSGHPIQIAGIGFTNKLDELIALGSPQVTIANSSYASTRAVLLQSQVWSNRNLIANSLQGVGLIMGGFIPFYSGSHPNAKLHFTTATAIVSGVALQAYNLIFPDPIIAQLKSLDDQSFRDSAIIPNNFHTQTVVFVEKQAVTLELRNLGAKINGASKKAHANATLDKANAETAGRSAAEAANLKDLSDSATKTVTNSTRPKLFKAESDPVLVKLALGQVVIVGDQIEYLQRVQIQSNALSSTTSIPLTAKPSSVTFSAHNGTIDGAAQSITLTNTGSSPLTSLTPKITGTAAGDFVMQTGTQDSCSSTLAAANTCSLSVAYSPSVAAGTGSSRTATLEVSFSPGSTPLAIALTGTASEVVYFSATALSLGVATSAKAGPPAVAPKASTAPLTITNLNSGPLTNLNTTSAEFTVSACAGGTLNSGASCTVTVTFQPAAGVTGPRSATLTASVAGQTLQAVSLSGIAQ